jgi:hypothetical protein
MVAAGIHAPGKRGPSFGKSYAGGNSARVAYSQGANQGLQGLHHGGFAPWYPRGGIQFTPFADVVGGSCGDKLVDLPHFLR